MLKKSGVLFHIDFSNTDMMLIGFLRECLNSLGIVYGKYTDQGRKSPIYGKRNFEKIMKFGLCNLHPSKKEKFEFGFGKYQRDVMKGKEMEKLILQQLNPETKTYDEISRALNKGRSTIQSHYIPILEKKGLIKRIGKRRQAWLFQITEDGIKTLNN